MHKLSYVEMDRPMCRKTVVGYLLLQLVLA